MKPLDNGKLRLTIVLRRPPPRTGPQIRAHLTSVVARFEGPLSAPIARGTKIGTAAVTLPDGRVIEYPLEAGADVARMGVFGRVTTMIRHYLFGWLS